MVTNTKLREYRLSKGVSVSAVARYLGVSRQTYAGYENDPDRMSVRQAQAVCTFLGCRLSDLFLLQEVN